MYNYLYTNDMRISDLSNSIKKVSEILLSGEDLYQVDKSFGNNGSTIQFYFNLQNNTETLIKGKDETIDVIKNFILKFQFPNTRTPESFINTINDKILFAPYRAIISVLYKLASCENGKSYLEHDEILFFFFCNVDVCTKPNFSIDRLIEKIKNYRLNPYNIEALIKKNLQWKQADRQLREMLTVLEYASNFFKNKNKKLSFMLSDSVEDNDFIQKIINYKKIWYPSDIKDFDKSNKEYVNYMDTAKIPYYVIDFNQQQNLNDKKEENSLQKIYYGAPGTGKSYTINKVTKNVYSDFVFRTTFHPDSDYSTFVGAYKPTMRELPRYNPQTGDKIGVEEKIVYSFVPQTFLNAYVKAWQNQDKSVYLVIEEINRGNCAQIFGDLFQLLDRTENGVSEYPIKADQDIKDYLVKAFAECEGLPEKIKSGDELQLPSNLYIWATMNTSDQSLFPIDSAFKRRWDWEYMPITKGVDKYGNEMNWSIVIGEKCYDWWEFLDKVNEKIGEETSSEDKKLGFFFCKADSNDEILIDKFVNKVLFYLWNDVFKTCGVEYHYKDGEAEKLLTFDKFHIKGGYDVDKIQNWLEKDLELSAKENLKSGDAYAETKEQSLKYARLNEDFWTKFLDYARNQSSRKDEYLEYFDGRKTPTDDHWYAFTLKKGCTLNVVQLRSQNKLFVGLAISKTDYNIFEKLKDKRGEIEKDLDLKPNTLVWDEKPDRKTDNIIHRIDVDFDESKQQEQFDWIIERLLKMREVFSKYLL